MPRTHDLRPRDAHRYRAGALGVLGAAAVAALAVVAAATLVSRVGTLSMQQRVRIDEAVTVLALAVMALALLWCGVLLLACAAGLLRPRRTTHAPEPVLLPWHLAPDLSMRVTGLLLTLTALGSGPAHAVTSPEPVSVVSTASAAAPVPGFAALTEARTETDPPVPSFGGGPVASQPAPVPSFGADAAARSDCPAGAPAPSWTPHRPAAVRAKAAEHVRLLAGCATQQTRAEIVVHRGDDLWSLVERHLGDRADPARIAEEWPHWYAANRDVIGPDPDALQVGQVLRIPEGALR